MEVAAVGVLLHVYSARRMKRVERGDEEQPPVAFFRRCLFILRGLEADPSGVVFANCCNLIKLSG